MDKVRRNQILYGCHEVLVKRLHVFPWGRQSQVLFPALDCKLGDMIPAKIVNSVVRGWRLVRVWKAQILILTLSLTLPFLTG